MRRASPWPVVLVLTAVGAGAGAAYSALAPRTYTATAQLIVSPLPAADTTFTGIAVFRESGGRHTAVQTAAALVESAQTANAVALQFGGKHSRDSLLASVSAHAVGGSDVVAVTARSPSATLAAQIANAFAQALVSQRTGLFQSELAAAIQHDTQTLGALTGAQRTALAKRLALLRTYVGRADPTIRTAAQAEPPASGRGRELRHAVAIGAGAGLAAGVVLALLLVALASWRALAGRLESLLGTLESAEARVAAREAALAERERLLEAALARAKRTPAVPARKRATSAKGATGTKTTKTATGKKTAKTAPSRPRKASSG